MPKRNKIDYRAGAYDVLRSLSPVEIEILRIISRQEPLSRAANVGATFLDVCRCIDKHGAGLILANGYYTTTIRREIAAVFKWRKYEFWRPAGDRGFRKFLLDVGLDVLPSEDPGEILKFVDDQQRARARLDPAGWRE